MKAILRSGVLALAIMALAVPVNAETERFGPFVYDPQSPKDLKLDGQIDLRSALNFRRAFDAHPEIERLYLDSVGGSVQIALLIADDVQRAGISTFIESNAECYSACAFIFFAGKIRQVDGRLGVHQVSAASERVDSQNLQINLSDIVEALNKYGVDPEVLEYMLRTPADEIYIFTGQEIARLNLNRTSQTALRLLPFIGNWDEVNSCDNPSFRFKADGYSVGGQDFIRFTKLVGGEDTIVEGGTGVDYNMTFPDGYSISLLNVTTASMTWHSLASGDTFELVRCPQSSPRPKTAP